MSEFVLRFVQEYAVGDREAFMDVEARFAAMERGRAPLITRVRTEIYQTLEL